MKILIKKFFYFYFLVLIISIASSAMEDKEIPKKHVKINKKSISYFEELPTELKELIASFLIDQNIETQVEFQKAIKNIKSLSFVNKEFRDIITSENFTRYIIRRLSNALQFSKISFFLNFIRKIGFKIPKDIIEKFKKQAIDGEFDKHQISQEDVNQWLKKKNLNPFFMQSYYGSKRKIENDREIKFLLGKAINEHDKVGIFALLNAGVNVPYFFNLVEHQREIKELEEKIELLRNIFANPDLQDENGDTALIKSAKEGSKHKVELLIEIGANLDLQNKDGNTALIEALKGCSAPSQFIVDFTHSTLKQIFELLLRSGANPNIQNSDGDNALHIAFKYAYGIKEIITLLLEAGADSNAKNIHGKTAIELAASQGHFSAVRLMKAHGGQLSKIKHFMSRLKH